MEYIKSKSDFVIEIEKIQNENYAICSKLTENFKNEKIKLEKEIVNCKSENIKL